MVSTTGVARETTPFEGGKTNFDRSANKPLRPTQMSYPNRASGSCGARCMRLMHAHYKDEHDGPSTTRYLPSIALAPSRPGATPPLSELRGESDYFIGAYTLNLIAVEVLLAFAFLVVVIMTWPNPPWMALQYGGVILSVLGAVLCYPFAKTTWLALDLIFRPPHREDFITRVK